MRLCFGREPGRKQSSFPIRSRRFPCGDCPSYAAAAANTKPGFPFAAALLTGFGQMFFTLAVLT